jgi:hypothetical protein
VNVKIVLERMMRRELANFSGDIFEWEGSGGRQLDNGTWSWLAYVGPGWWSPDPVQLVRVVGSPVDQWSGSRGFLFSWDGDKDKDDARPLLFLHREMAACS